MSFYQFARHVCTALLYVAFNYKVEGLENLPKDGGFVLCSNHRSYLDPVFLALRVKRQLNFMAKEELFQVKVLGPIIKKLGAFPVARGKGDTGAVDFAIQTIKDGKVMTMFPEGTRSKTGELLKFKSGAVVIAAQSQGSIVPACIDFKGKLRFRRRVTVRFGKPISCEELHLDSLDKHSLKAAREVLSQQVSALLEAGR
ncbi:MAG: lysophospholipid acyltransferase family protein [Oscillospiraceae bacterium]|jgi:1-acyl-sn-glycerol-3-phosphate acyltransferase